MSEESSPPFPSLDVNSIRGLIADIISFSPGDENEPVHKEKLNNILEGLDMPPASGTAEILEQLKMYNTNIDNQLEKMNANYAKMNSDIIRLTSLQFHKNQKGGGIIYLVPTPDGLIPKVSPFTRGRAFDTSVMSMSTRQLGQALEIYGVRSVPAKERLARFLTLMGYPVAFEDESEEDEDEE